MSSSKTQFPQSVEVATQPQSSSSWQIELLYDGECPLCLREVNFLKKRDAGRGWVKFADIADNSYTPEEHGGVDFEMAMGRIHAVLADGTVIKNVEVFRRVYEILGMGWIYAATEWPIIGAIVDRLYGIWVNLSLISRCRIRRLVAVQR